MDSRKEKIWDNIATINVPDCFKVSTIGEMRKVYGINKNMPEKMLVDREKRAFFSVNKMEEPKLQQEKGIVEVAQIVNHLLGRSVPGYKCKGIYKKQIQGREACVVQYTSYTIEDNIYTMMLLMQDKQDVYMLNCVCKNALVPELHPVFLGVIESVQYEGDN